MYINVKSILLTKLALISIKYVINNHVIKQIKVISTILTSIYLDLCMCIYYRIH